MPLKNYAVLTVRYKRSFSLYFFDFCINAAPGPIKVLKAVFYVSEILFGSSLAFTAIYLARFIKTVTGNKPNLCLLVWHITNVFIYAVTLITLTVTEDILEDAIDKVNSDDPCLELDVSKAQQNNLYVWIILNCVEFYVDLFLLWLLYKFM